MKLCCAIIIAISLISNGWAVSGVGVTYSQNHSNLIIVSYIENDHLVATDSLRPTGSNVRVRSPAINTYGTHVAFMKLTDSGNFVSVMRADNAISTDKQLVKVNCTKGFVDWPAGDWVYYNPDDSRKEFWKVNVHTGKTEKLASFGYSDNREWKSSADGKHMFYLIRNNTDACTGRFLYTFPGSGTNGCNTPFTDGGILYGKTGCSVTMSASGMYVGQTTNAGHANYVIGKVTYEPRSNVTEMVFTNKDWNSWSVDDEFACEIVRSDGTVDVDNVGWGIIGGMGDDGSSWSTNSDYWISLNLGWAPRGRFKTNGGNHVLIGWKAKKSVNITRMPPVTDSKHVNPCAKPDAVKFFPNHSDFWVSAPVEDIWELVRDHVNPENQNAYRIAGLDEAVRIGFSASHVPSQQVGISMQITSDAIEVNNCVTGSRVELFDSNGRLISRAFAQKSSAKFSRLTLLHGMYIVRIISGSQILARKISF